MNRENDPSGFWGSIVSAGSALVALLVAFGAPITEDQQSALLGVLAAAGPLVAQLLIRRDAWSPVAHFRELRDVETMTDEDGAVDLQAIVWLLVIVILVVVLLRLL